MRIITSHRQIHVLIKLPGMNGSYHRSNTVSLARKIKCMTYIAPLFGGSQFILIVLQPGIGYIKPLAILRNISIDLKSRSQITELMMIIQIKRWSQLCTKLQIIIYLCSTSYDITNIISSTIGI